MENMANMHMIIRGIAMVNLKKKIRELTDKERKDNNDIL